MSAMASLLSEVKGMSVEDMWVKKIAGPEGMPFPEDCSKPYLLQSIDDIAEVETQSPCWYKSGTRLANRINFTVLSFGRLPP